MNKSAPRVTVVIPAYNSESFLGDAIESVFAQEYDGEIEVIVVDDGSTDGTAEVAEKYPEVKLFRQPNQGPGLARNVAIEAATGEVIALLDSDDLMLPGRLRKQVDHLREHPEDGAVIGLHHLRVSPGVAAPLWLFSQARVAVEGDEQNTGILGQYVTATLMAWRRTFDEVGLYDPAFQHGEDVDWLIRVMDAGKTVGTIDEALITRRIHGQNMVLDEVGVRHGTFQALKARIDRGREGGSASDPE
jgi:glycosyltransferase involved in cell wall biosynthesis